MSSLDMTSLTHRWHHHAEKVDVSEDVLKQYWEVIRTRYSEKHRYYHTLQHLDDMFHHFDGVKDEIEKPHLVAMAIFFHDVIYEPKEKDNEEKSADLFKEFAKNSTELKDTEDGNRVIEWILETKRHQTDVHATSGVFGNSDLQYFLDMDMAVLGTPEDEYEKYAINIRREYSHYSPDAYNQGRAKVLRTFLEIPNIFATKVFREKFEAQARKNIKHEIERLENGTQLFELNPK